MFRNEGYCICCDQAVTFSSAYDWLRDHYRCEQCQSIPKERALMTCLELYIPHWRQLKIHESSPVWSGASHKIKQQCRDYLPSMYFSDVAPGQVKDGFRNENLESLTFEDAVYDLHVTSDVLEHVMFPKQAFQEMARTLKPGGIHIFTVPLIRKSKSSIRRAGIAEATGMIHHFEEPQYHGDHLVTYDWGYDIVDIIAHCSGLQTRRIVIEDFNLGLNAEFNDVLISIKPETSKQ